MTITRLFEGIADIPEILKGIEIENIISNSKLECDEKTVFVCIKGATFDGHSVAEDMLKKGCAVVVCERDLGVERQIVVSDTRLCLSMLYANFYGNPQNKMKLVGVTGTNGKTTITTVIKRLFDKMGIKAGLIGTCQNEIGDKVIHTSRTTPEPNEFYALLAQMQKEGCEYVVMEVSSQGLAQKRIGAPLFEVAAFTNLTQDHLDVHGDFESYYNAKKLLFSMCKKAVINIDDSYSKRFISEISCEADTFSIVGEADIAAKDITLMPHGSEFKVSVFGKEYSASFKIAGDYNVSNCCAIIAVMNALGFDTKSVIKNIADCSGVRGRCESIPTGRGFSVICDYAHTPDAIENILSSVKKYASGRVICLFGCGGNRDKTKRPLMAKAAQKYSDFIIVTSDNPRNEDPQDIINDILTGVEGENYITICDRHEAICWAVKNARADDIIVMVGKGHEDYQELEGGRKIHFDEREEVAKALALL